MARSSSSVSVSRARWATQRTSSAVSAMAAGLDGGHGERPALLRPLDPAAAHALGADALAADGAVDLGLDGLEVGLEGALGGAGDLLADAAEVLGLAAVGVLPAV